MLCRGATAVRMKTVYTLKEVESCPTLIEDVFEENVPSEIVNYGNDDDDK